MRIIPASSKNFSVQQNISYSDLSFKRREEEKRSVLKRIVNAFKPLPHIKGVVSGKINKENLEKAGFEEYGECSFDIFGIKTSGSIFVKESKDGLGTAITIKVTDSMFDTKGEAYANILSVRPEVATVGFNPVRGVTIPGLMQPAYDSLFRYINDKHPEIKTAKTDINPNYKQDLYAFHIRYGFVAEKNLPMYHTRRLVKKIG